MHFGSLRNETPLKIQFYYETNIPQPKNIISRAWQRHQFDFGLILQIPTLSPEKTRLLIVQGPTLNGERGKGEREKGETVGEL